MSAGSASNVNCKPIGLAGTVWHRGVNGAARLRAPVYSAARCRSITLRRGIDWSMPRSGIIT